MTLRFGGRGGRKYARAGIVYGGPRPASGGVTLPIALPRDVHSRGYAAAPMTPKRYVPWDCAKNCDRQFPHAYQMPEWQKCLDDCYNIWQGILWPGPKPLGKALPKSIITKNERPKRRTRRG